MASTVMGRLAFAIDSYVLVCGLYSFLIEHSCKIAEALVILPLCAAWCENDNEIIDDEFDDVVETETPVEADKAKQQERNVNNDDFDDED